MLRSHREAAINYMTEYNIYRTAGYGKQSVLRLKEDRNITISYT
jgi:hypothetical protein